MFDMDDHHLDLESNLQQELMQVISLKMIVLSVVQPHT